jgi:1-acyl-sn-glycerol-3-phosphate acyltransferase
VESSTAPESLEERAGAEPASLRMLFKGAAAALATLLAILPPVVVRIATLGARNPAARVGARCCHAWGKALCRVFRIEVTLAGKAPRGAFLVASNHVSYLDILVLASLYPSAFVAKLEIGGWPVFGWIARSAGTLFVDRTRPRDVVRAGREMRSHLEAGIPLTMFPEGGSSSGETVKPFLPSLLEPAADTGVPCYAASVTYETTTHEPPSRILSWRAHEPFGPKIAGILRQRRILATVTIAEEPVVSNDRKVLAQELWNRVHASYRPMRRD